MTQALQTISFSVPRLVYQNIERRARTMNLRPAEYSRRLHDAAYLARIAQERGQGSGDAELDRRVFQVFLMADVEPEFIAQALDCSVAFVKRAIEAWKVYARESDGTAAPALPSPDKSQPEGGAAPTDKPKKGSRWTDEDRLTLKRMWVEGKQVPEIAAALGRTPGTVQQYAVTHRGLCPKRR